MNTYFVAYNHQGKTFEWSVYCSGPVVALNEFHRDMQLNKECDADRNVIRNPLKPADYRILSLFLRYRDKEGDVRSEFDLPNCGNPNLWDKTKRVDRGTEFDFAEEVKGAGRLSEG